MQEARVIQRPDQGLHGRDTARAGGYDRASCLIPLHRNRHHAPQRPPLIPRSRVFIALFVGLLVVNLVASFMTGGPDERERVPYQPFFVDQLEAGNVEEITSRADSIEGELSEAATYDPPGDDEPVDVTRVRD